MFKPVPLHFTSEGTCILISLLRFTFQLLCSCILIFFLFSIVPSDPTLIILGKYASQAQIQELREQLGLNLPVFKRLLLFLMQIGTLDFGVSLMTKESIKTLLADSILVSASLLLPAYFISTALAIIASGITLCFRITFLRTLFMSIICIPSLFLIMIGQLVFAFYLGFFPICGLQEGFWGSLYSLLLPASLFGILNMAFQFQQFYPMLLSEFQKPYTLALKARGFSLPTIFFKHTLKSSCPMLIQFTFSELPSILLSGILLESFFTLPGLGSCIVDSIQNADLPVMQAITVISAFFSLTCAQLADMINRWMDPRLKT
jgi:peptide/nickel transport system permease protein